MTGKQPLNLDKALIKERQLEQFLRNFETALVAFSGGVDSAYLLSKALDTIGRKQVLAVTVKSPLNQPEEAEAAAVFARKLKAKHLFLNLDPLGEEQFSDNPPQRCYHCKKIIYTELLKTAASEGLASVLDGTNADDPASYRPGLRALGELGICSPLLEVSLGKEEIRALAKHSGLPLWDKQAAPCLASRFPYGEKITREKLMQVAEAELFLRQLGVKQNLRVRCHNKLARIEVNEAELEFVLAERELIVRKLLGLGFVYITLDLYGFETGSLDRLLSLD